MNPYEACKTGKAKPKKLQCKLDMCRLRTETSVCFGYFDNQETEECKESNLGEEELEDHGGKNLRDKII